MTQEEIRYILSESASCDAVERIRKEARQVADSVFGRAVYVRALIETTNLCRNNCFYCGIRCDSRYVVRYTLSSQEILGCCEKAYTAGFRTFVLQGGENPQVKATDIALMVEEIKSRYPDCAVTLSLGEWSDEDLMLFRRAGADRYLLRQETIDQRHYSRLHPPSMSLSNRVRCLRTLKALGYQTGTGIMVGSPYQTTEHILKDIEFMRVLKPEMIGIGPFIPASGTPFESYPPGSVDLTLRLISVLRILFPLANIPATTALATLGGADGRIAGLLAGANVIMPNVTPANVRSAYRLYDNKACQATEALDGLQDLRSILQKAGFHISFSRGDAPAQS